MKVEKTPYEILAKHLSGSATEVEREQIKAWIKSSREAKIEYEEFVEIWNERYFQQEDNALINQEEIGKGIWEKAFGNEKGLQVNWVKQNSNALLKIAAVFAVFISMVFYSYMGGLEKELAQSKVLVVEKQTLPGQKSTITLPDGSIVSLNSGSKIWYPSNFGQNDRTIELEGQAFFDVYKDPNNPFVVTCRNVQVEALGTSFDVNAYRANQVQVSLLTGKVRLTSEGASKNELVLLPGQYSVVDIKNVFTQPGQFNTEEVLAWKNGKLIFNEQTLTEIIPTLELWYGVRIQNKTKLSSAKHFNGTFERESLEHILENIGLSMGFGFEFRDNKVLLK